jgi:oxygen-dependent protoporphyrinogen oxidase
LDFTFAAMMTTIGVLGGGISGLATAFHLARRIPTSYPAKIILIEKSNRLGGWIQSDNVDVQGNSVVLESGPRTLRPRSLEMLELV